MDLRDETQRLRAAGQELDDGLKRAARAPTRGSPSRLVATTVVRAYPTAAHCYYAVQPLEVRGTALEGAPALVSQSSVTFFALNLGSSVPPVGTEVLVTFVGNRWVFRYDD